MGPISWQQSTLELHSFKGWRSEEEDSGCHHHWKFLANAPIGIAVVIDPRDSKHPVEDGSIATENMLLAVHALGLGACWIGAYNSVYEKRVKEILGIPNDKRVLSIISIGFPAESPMKTRKELGEIVFTDRYGRK